MIAPLLPPEPEKPRGGRLRASDRSAPAGIILVLRTGMQWKHVPRAALGCSGKTIWRRLGVWQAAWVWANLHRLLPDHLDAVRVSAVSRIFIVESSHGNEAMACVTSRRPAEAIAHAIICSFGQFYSIILKI